MDQRPEMRASDTDRQAAVDRLRIAHDEGRLNLTEFDTRVATAYQAVTYGDLAALFADLPEKGQLAPPPPAPVASPIASPIASPVASSPVEATGFVGNVPTAVKVLWTIWGSVLLVVLTTWLLVDVSHGGGETFWPMWLLIPTALLVGSSVGATSISRSRRPGWRLGGPGERRSPRRETDARDID